MTEQDEQEQEREQDEQEQQRVSKREFLARVATRSDIPARTVIRVYEAILDELKDTVRGGSTLMLTGFGKFYRQKHKGHRVQFSKTGDAIDHYWVLKFSATRSVNKSVADGAEGHGDENDEEFEPTTKSKAGSKRKRDLTVTAAAEAMQSGRTIKRTRRRLVDEVLKDAPTRDFE